MSVRKFMQICKKSEDPMREIGHFIGGKHVAGTSGRYANVFNPSTGEIQARVALATAPELRAAVLNAKAAQIGWAAQNPQKRARVLMKFLELIAKDHDSLAALLASEHGKTIPDAKGDIQRGLEVIEFCLGIPTSSKASSPIRRALASTSIPCASRSAWWRASPPSTSRP